MFKQRSWQQYYEFIAKWRFTPYIVVDYLHCFLPHNRLT